MLNPTEIELIEGDCLDILKEIPSGTANLAYLDPPFFTQKIHTLAPRDRSRKFLFRDLWDSNSEYADFLGVRLEELCRVLSTSGTVFVHCDRNSNHIIRFLLDQVFGSGNFRSEIVWSYRRWSNSFNGLLPAHQVIYYYTKSSDFTFNRMLSDYSPSTNVDQILQRRTRDEHNKSVYLRDTDGNVITNGAKLGVPLSDVWDIPYLVSVQEFTSD